jgi:hypothetical protein
MLRLVCTVRPQINSNPLSFQQPNFSYVSTGQILIQYHSDNTRSNTVLRFDPSDQRYPVKRRTKTHKDTDNFLVTVGR